MGTERETYPALGTAVLIPHFLRRTHALWLRPGTHDRVAVEAGVVGVPVGPAFFAGLTIREGGRIGGRHGLWVLE